MKSSSSVRLLVLVFMLVGLFLRVGAGMKFPNVNHTDEIIETQEPAHHLAYGYSVVAWEWRQGARSWVFPAFLAGVMRTTDWMGSGSAACWNGYCLYCGPGPCAPPQGGDEINYYLRMHGN